VSAVETASETFMLNTRVGHNVVRSRWVVLLCSQTFTTTELFIIIDYEPDLCSRDVITSPCPTIKGAMVFKVSTSPLFCLLLMQAGHRSAPILPAGVCVVSHNKPFQNGHVTVLL